MTHVDQKDDEISLFALGTTLIRHRWRVVRWMLFGAIVAAGLVITKPALYWASASFVSQGGEASHSGLASLAGQFGVALPVGGDQSLSPEFYSALLKSRVLLLPIVQSTFVVPEMGGKRVSFFELFEVKGKSTTDREDRAIKLFRSLMTVSVDKNTGVVEFSVPTKWRSVSLAIATKLLDGVNEYNLRTRRGQASAERQFVERRLALANVDLRESEDRLEYFLLTNRDLGGAPALLLQRDRLQRDLGLRQQVFTTLTQSYEDARVREVRDIPVITVFEPPSVPAAPAPRRRAVSILLGFLLGGVVGMFLVLASQMVSHNRENGSPEAREFIHVLDDMKGKWRRLAVWRKS